MTKAQFLADNLNPGETYAGLLLGQNGEPDQHLILLPGALDAANWKTAIAWAKKAGGELPSRRELRLLWVNAKAEFKEDWYWSSEQPAAYSDFAWYQNFASGYQLDCGKSAQLRARAVRRLAI